jgi:polar amino acid transport system substrate-binding protein
MKKILSLIISFGLVLSLVACGGAGSAAKSEAGSAQKLIMCTNAEFPPYEYKEGGQFAGIDVECARLIGSKLGYEVEILDIAFDSLIPTVMSGKADFAMAGMTVTEDRLKNIDFTHTYQTAVQTIVVPSNSSIENADDLSGKKIGVQTGTTGDIYCTGDFGEDAIERYSKIIDGFQAMKSGKIDACVVDDQVAKSIVAADSGSFKILETAYANEEYAIAVKKGNTELLNKLNSVIDEIKSNGELKKIIDKYIK